jgi:hypothetical protein
LWLQKIEVITVMSQPKLDAHFKRAEKRLIAQFQDILTPSACVYLLVVWVNSAQSDYTVPPPAPRTSEILERLSRRIMNMFWKWVTRPRTDEELRALVDLECSCSPNERQEADHELGKRKTASLGFAPAWLIIEDCLYP